MQKNYKWENIKNRQFKTFYKPSKKYFQVLFMQSYADYIMSLRILYDRQVQIWEIKH